MWKSNNVTELGCPYTVLFSIKSQLYPLSLPLNYVWQYYYYFYLIVFLKRSLEILRILLGLLKVCNIIYYLGHF